MLGRRGKNITSVLAILVIPALMLSNVAISVSENIADHDRLLPDPPTAQTKSQMSNGTLGALGVQAEILKLPLSFIENKGQVSDDTKFMVKTSHETVYFEPSEVLFAVTSKKNTSIVRMSFEGAKASQLLGENRLSGKANFFIGNNSSKWVTDIPTYSSVKYGSLYPGVDLVFKGTEGNLKHEFVLKPGVDPDKIILAFSGQDSLSIDKNGSIQIKTGTDNLTDSAPLCYQDVNGKRVNVKGEYRRIDDKRIGFEIQDYNRSLPLVIDPFLRYSTYLGGSGDDLGWSIAVDGSGNAYVTGETSSTNFPTTPGANQTTYRGNVDAFVAKLNPSGSGLIYSTYLGGSDYDCGRNIAVDSSGNAYVTGYTSSTNFPTTPGANQTTYRGNVDAFVAKLNPSGSGLVYSTYLGGSEYDVGTIMAVDGSRNVHVIGITYSADFPVTPGAYQTTYTAGGNGSAFVTKLDSSGSGLVYSTYLGGSYYNVGRGIAVDSSGNAYVTGSTSSTDFPTTPDAYQTAYGGGTYNAFVTKLNPSGSGLVYSTYLGGSDGTDYGKSIAVDSSGNAYVTGGASSTDFPTTPGAYQAANAGNSDAFIAMIVLNAPPKDMSVTKIACTGSTKNISEVEAGSQFYYNISVINSYPDTDAVDVVVTDKLPYDIVYDSAKAQASNGETLTNATIHKTSDLLYVNFEKIPKGKTFYINVTVYAPAEAPTTLYNVVNVRSANIPSSYNSTMTLATYVPVTGYGKAAAVESFEELLHNQTQLLFDFEDLLHVVPKNRDENFTFITSFEQLLRAQANLSLSFEDLLENETNTGWDLGNFSKEERIDFLKSFKRIIWDEAFLFSSFEMKLKDAWMSLHEYKVEGHCQDAQTEFIASFEDLLKEQVKLFDSYQLLLKTVGDIPSDDNVDAFAAFENLLRVEANLLMSFEDVLKKKYLNSTQE